MAVRRWLALVGLVAISLLVDPVPATAAPDPTTAGVADPATAQLDARWADHPIDVRPAPMPATAATAPDRPDLGPVTGEQVAVTNAAAWHAAGIRGAGVKVGVIDFFDVERYWNPSEHGPLPVAGVTARCFAFGQDCTATYFDSVSSVGDDHGVAVVEIIADMAPDAQIYIGTAATLADYRALVDWFAAQRVTIVSRSLSSGYDGPGDGRGALDDLAAHANALGITWVNSVGNSGFGRYYRQPVRLSGNRVAFGPTGSATYLPFVGCAALGGVRWSNDWDRAPSDRTDYDVYLWDAPAGSPASGRLVAASTADQRDGAVPIEFFEQDHCPSDRNRVLYLEVRWVGGDITGDVLEILDYASGLAAYTQAAYSASTSIADSALPGVLAVGAIDPADTGTIASYSSQGPTNDDRLAPDLSAPAGLSSTVIRNGFSGTSASAPVVAGGVALLRSAGLAADPASLGDLARHLVVDRGAAGPDQQYGAGEFRLPAPPAAAVGPVATKFQPVTAPMRVLDTRPTSPAGPPEAVGVLSAGDIVDLPLAGIVPPGATAVAVNLTAVALDRPSFVQALPTLGAQVGGYSNVNVDEPFQTRSNFSIVPIGADGSISLYSTGGGDLVVDLLGSFVPTAATVAEGRFVPLEVPERVLDSRTDGCADLGLDDRRAVAHLDRPVAGCGARGHRHRHRRHRTGLDPGAPVRRRRVRRLHLDGQRGTRHHRGQHRDRAGRRERIVGRVGARLRARRRYDRCGRRRRRPHHVGCGAGVVRGPVRRRGAGAGVRLPDVHRRPRCRCTRHDRRECGRGRSGAAGRHRCRVERRRARHSPPGLRARLGRRCCRARYLGVQLVGGGRDPGDRGDQRRCRRPGHGDARRRSHTERHSARRVDRRRVRLLHLTPGCTVRLTTPGRTRPPSTS